MGEFDDVLAMEPGDEWDDHVVGASADAEVVHGPLQATLRLPNALVELRGEPPSEVVDALSDLSDERLELLGGATSLRLSVTREDDRWVLDGAGGRAEVADNDDDLLRAVVARLDALAVDTDPMRLHLAVACVRLAERGVVLVQASPVEHGADDLTLVVADLLELGADFVTAGLLSLLPGSRTVFGHPSPPSTSAHAPVRASTVASVVPFAQVDHVVVLDRLADGPTAAGELPVTDAVVHLLRAAVDADRIGPAALDVVAQVIRGATCTEIHHSDPNEVAATVAAVVAASSPPSPARLCVVHRFDDPGHGAIDRSEVGPSGAPVPAAVQRARRSLRVARFDALGVLLDGASGTLMMITPDELDALEARLVATKLPLPEGRLTRLADAGVRLPTQRGARAVPGVESYGLPNCPAGAVAASMWAGAAPTTLAAASQPGADVPGAVAQAVERGVVTPAPAEQGSILDRHALARRLVELVEATLHQVLDIAARHDVVPLVLGSGVLAHDGMLPEESTDAEQVDLLVDPDSLPVLLDALVDAGFEATDQGPSDGSDAPTVHELASAGAVPVTVRIRARLAVGPFAALVNHEEFHDRSVPVWIGERWCRTLHPEHRFVLTCVQLDLDATHSTVQDLRDVVLSAPRIEAHMAEALEASERWGAVGSVLTSLRRVHAVMPGLSPWLVERAERDDGRRRRGDRNERPARGLRRLRRG